MTIQIIDNFLPAFVGKEVKTHLEDFNWPWYFTDIVTYEGLGEEDDPEASQFLYMMYWNYSWVGAGEAIVSKFIPYLKPISLYRVKANLQVRTAKIKEYAFHTDVPNPEKSEYKDMVTAVYYVNSNDGATIFEDGTRVESVENRLAIFPTTMKHAGTTCTNAKRRMVINFNFFPEKNPFS